MLKELSLSDILFIDIETIPAYASLEEAPESEQRLWEKKARQIGRNEESPAALYPRAGIYAEFGRVLCISTGRISGAENDLRLHIRSFAGGNERTTLERFGGFLGRMGSNTRLCAHNGKEFDFPYIARRMLVQGLPLPRLLNIAGRKPWEIGHLDTLELWKFGDYKHYTSLELLAHVFGLPSPKDNMDGSQVADVWWKERNLKKIRSYCEQDVVTLVQLLRRYRGEALLDDSRIEIVRDTQEPM